MAETQAQIIPSSELTGLENALAELDQEAAALTAIRLKAESLTVSTDEEYAQAGAMLVEIRAVKKIPAQKINPFLEITARVTTFLRNVRTQGEEKAAAIEKILLPKMTVYDERERLRTAQEQARQRERDRIEAARIAEEQRKIDEAQAKADREKREKEIKEAQAAGELNKRAAEKARKQAAEDEARAKAQAKKDEEEAKKNVRQVVLTPSIPKVAGLRKTPRVWRFKIVNPSAIPNHFMVKVPDEKTIGIFVRATQDKAKCESAIPGIEVQDFSTASEADAWSQDV